MKGNIDSSYEFDELKSGVDIKNPLGKYIHIRCVQLIHDGAAQEYTKNVRIVKIYPHHYDVRKKHGVFRQFKTVDIVHDPRQESGKTSGINATELEELKSDYKLLYDAEAPGEVSINQLKEAIKEMSETKKEEVRALYLSESGNKPGNKSTLTLLKELQ